MTTDTAPHDEVLAALAWLGPHEPDRARDARIRARCHASFDRHRRLARTSPRPSWRRALEPALVGGLCAVYLLEVLGRALRLYSF